MEKKTEKAGIDVVKLLSFIPQLLTKKLERFLNRKPPLFKVESYGPNLRVEHLKASRRLGRPMMTLTRNSSY